MSKRIALEGLDLSQYKDRLQIKNIDGAQKIFCHIRRKYLVLQPEEFVRQLWVHYLIEEWKFSDRLIQIEKQIIVLGQRKRFDLMVYDQTHQPTVLFEFKSFQYNMSDVVFEQIALYNMALKIPALVISNGREHYAAKIDFENKSFVLLPSMKMAMDK